MRHEFDLLIPSPLRRPSPDHRRLAGRTGAVACDWRGDVLRDRELWLTDENFRRCFNVFLKPESNQLLDGCDSTRDVGTLDLTPEEEGIAVDTITSALNHYQRIVRRVA
jgi:hypothetical protein